MRQQQPQLNQSQLNQSTDIPPSNEWSAPQMVQMKLEAFSASHPVVSQEADRGDMGGSDLRMRDTFANSGETMEMDMSKNNLAPSGMVSWLSVILVSLQPRST